MVQNLYEFDLSRRAATSPQTHRQPSNKPDVLDNGDIT